MKEPAYGWVLCLLSHLGVPCVAGGGAKIETGGVWSPSMGKESGRVYGMRYAASDETSCRDHTSAVHKAIR